MKTPTWQLSTLPRWPHHWRFTPTECVPRLGKLLGSKSMMPSGWPARCSIFFFNDTATTEIYTLSLHDALPISRPGRPRPPNESSTAGAIPRPRRSEEHTSELQSPCNLVCRLLLEKKKTHR